MKTLRLRVSGLVQGVFFRQSTCEFARARGLVGWVRNCPDGTVEALASGDDDAISALVLWSLHGPERARVDELNIVHEPTPSTATSFEVLR